MAEKADLSSGMIYRWFNQNVTPSLDSIPSTNNDKIELILLKLQELTNEQINVVLEVVEALAKK